MPAHQKVEDFDLKPILFQYGRNVAQAEGHVGPLCKRVWGVYEKSSHSTILLGETPFGRSVTGSLSCRLLCGANTMSVSPYVKSPPIRTRDEDRREPIERRSCQPPPGQRGLAIRWGSTS